MVRLRRHADDLSYAAGLLCGLGVLVVGGFVQYREHLGSATDFTLFWAGSRALVEGIDPYSPATYHALLARYTSPTLAQAYVYVYAPWVAAALLPLAWLPLPIATDVWTFGTLLLAVFSLRALLRAMLSGVPLAHGLLGFALLASQPGIATFFSNQWGFLLVAAEAAAVVSLRAGWPAGGLAMLLLLAKPQQFLFAGWAFVAASVARNVRAFAAVSVAGVLAVVGVIVLVARRELLGWIRLIVFDQVAPPPLLNDPAATTLPAALTDLFGPLGAAMAVVLLATGVAIGLRFSPKTDAWLAVWMAFSVAAAIYARSYDQVVLVVPLAVAAGVLNATSHTAAARFVAVATIVFVLGSILLYAVAAARGREDTSVLVPVAVYVLVVSALWTKRATRNATLTAEQRTSP